MSFFFDELFQQEEDYPENVSAADRRAILEKFSLAYDPADDNNQWFDKIKTISQELGFAGNTKDYKKDPDAYKGHVGDVSMVIRVAVTGRTNSPDMYEVMQVLGARRVKERLAKGIV